MNISFQNYPSAIKSKFQELFNQEPLIVRSPGRINLIGEHTDYNMGFVLPAAINKAIYLGIQKRNDNEIHLHALDYTDDHTATTDNLVKSGKLWPDYVLGVFDQISSMSHVVGNEGTQLVKHGEENKIHRMDKLADGKGNVARANVVMTGFNVVFGGDIPPGAGLSSSAALECATAYALNELFDLGFEKLSMVKMSQAAENEFVGMKCGIMDQFASMFGQKDQLIRLDCRSLDYSYIPFNLKGVTVVLFDTRVKHSLASSAYNERREQCEEGVRLINGGGRSEVGSLRDATEEMLVNYVKPVNEVVYKRCSFVVAENERLLAGCKDLENNDVAAFGRKMFETHHGLSNLYEVSCKELDILVDLVKDNADVLGARMMGGGFGGCTINLVRNEAVDDLVITVAEEYKKETGIEMLVYKVGVENGTEMIVAS